MADRSGQKCELDTGSNPSGCPSIAVALAGMNGELLSPNSGPATIQPSRYLLEPTASPRDLRNILHDLCTALERDPRIVTPPETSFVGLRPTGEMTRPHAVKSVW